jgi:hypothetical protein
MDIDKYDLGNYLTSCSLGFTSKIINVLSDGGNAGTIDKIILEIGIAALNFENAKRQKRLNNINPLTDLTIEQRDDQGRRRYNLACIDDEPCMKPDSGGFWTPVNG